MQQQPRYGYYPWWPEDGDAWLHPEDVAQARKMIPSWRVFRRAGEQPPYVVLHYGAVRLRVLRTLWQEVTPEGFEIGDWVEVLSRGLRNTPCTGVIQDLLWDPDSRCLRYLVREQDKLLTKPFARDDLRHVEALQEPDVEHP